MAALEKFILERLTPIPGSVMLRTQTGALQDSTAAAAAKPEHESFNVRQMPSADVS